MIRVEFDLTDQPPISTNKVEQAARAALDLTGAVDSDLVILITGNERIQALNKEFLGIDAPTDVLAFPAEEIDPETGRRYLGDIIISLTRAAKQAEDGGHPVEAEVQLLVIHGTLHLLGYDHAITSDKKRMWSIQAEILSRIEIPATIIHE